MKVYSGIFNLKTSFAFLLACVASGAGAQSIVAKSNVEIGSYQVNLPSSEALDYLVQDVCVDSNDKIQNIDPYYCLSSGFTLRNLRLGEDLPYSKYSQVIRNNEYIPSSYENSYPLWNNKFLAIRTMDHAGTTSVGRNADANDGYDILEANGSWASIIGTKDPVTTSKGFVWWGENCQMEDGWSLFPTENISSMKFDQPSYSIFDIRGGETCNVSTDKFTTTFTYYAHKMFRYSSNKLIETLKTHHFASGDPYKTQSIETFYTTKLYGLTRWEAWKTYNSCVANNSEEYCTLDAIKARAAKDGTCNGDVEMKMFGQTFYRIYCVDNSNIELHANRPLHPFYTELTSTFSLARNLVKDGDFSSPLEGIYTVYSGSVATINLEDSDKVLKTKMKKNPYLEISGRGLEQSLFLDKWSQDKAMLQAGALIKGAVGGKIKLQIDVIYKDKTSASEFVIVQIDESSKWQPVRFNFPLDLKSNPIAKLRIKVLPLDNGTYQVDELFTSLLPLQ